jgi:magnesium transporter
MHAALITAAGSRMPADEPTIRQLLADGTAFWLDLLGSGKDSIPILRDVFSFHPLAIEDAEHFGQRPKVDDYDDYVLIVLYGAPSPTRSVLVELHCLYSERYLVTVRREPCSELDHFADRLTQPGRPPLSQIMLLHGVLDALVDSFFPALADFDDEIDELEDAILDRPTDEQLGRLFDMKRSLIAVRKVITPARDTFAGVVGGVGRLPGMTAEAERYFRDLYDHLIRISDLVDSYRDLLSGVLDTHLSTVSNRLNAVMKQLTIIATLFLPLTYLTGFFGQNFEFLISNITGFPAFLGFGIGLEVAAIVGLLTMFWKRGWLSGESTTHRLSQGQVRRRHKLRLAHAMPAHAHSRVSASTDGATDGQATGP